MALQPAISTACSVERRGYSMLELALTLAIIGVMAAVALPRLASSGSSTKADRAAEFVAGLLRSARASAVATSTTVVVTLNGDTVVFSVVDPATSQAADISDLIASPPEPDRIRMIGPGAVSASTPQQERERLRARRASLLALQDEPAAPRRNTTSTTAEYGLPAGAVFHSADFGGDASLTFNGHGLPDSGGWARLDVGPQTRRVRVNAGTGEVSVSQ